MGWKEGFRQDSSSYKKRDRYKDTLREEAREVFREELKNLLSQQNPELLNQLASQMLMPSQTVMKSSGASMTGKKYPVDDIVADTPCKLNILIGRAGKSMEVGTGVAMPGRQFHWRSKGTSLDGPSRPHGLSD